MDEQGILTKEEQERLEFTYGLRRKILDNSFADGRIPVEHEEIEVLDGVMKSMDKQIFDKANARLKQKENQTKEETLSAVAEALKRISSDKAKNINSNRSIEVQDDIIPIETVEGEMDINPIQLNISDIITDKE